MRAETEEKAYEEEVTGVSAPEELPQEPEPEEPASIEPEEPASTHTPISTPISIDMNILRRLKL